MIKLIVQVLWRSCVSLTVNSFFAMWLQLATTFSAHPKTERFGPCG